VRATLEIANLWTGPACSVTARPVPTLQLQAEGWVDFTMARPGAAHQVGLACCHAKHVDTPTHAALATHGPATSLRKRAEPHASAVHLRSLPAPTGLLSWSRPSACLRGAQHDAPTHLWTGVTNNTLELANQCAKGSKVSQGSPIIPRLLLQNAGIPLDALQYVELRAYSYVHCDCGLGAGEQLCSLCTAWHKVTS
jgi:hypothetical protein